MKTLSLPGKNLDPTTVLESGARQPDYRRIADGLRDEILTGKCPPGTQLPSTGELATLWNSSPSTVHTALVALVKEGWIQRLNGAGTFVADIGNRFVCAGIYHASEICSHESPPFMRSLHMSLLEQFRKLGKETLVFVDTRPKAEQKELLPSLAKAILERRIQCLVAPSVSQLGLPAMARLKLPTAFLTNPVSNHFVSFDYEDMLHESVRRLAAQGCRSVGVLGGVNPQSANRELATFYRRFENVAQTAGLMTRAEWIRKPLHGGEDFEGYGYTEFLRFWELDEKPDGVLIYPDSVVQGAITAILELGVHVVPQRMKFVFHRNAHIRLLCPFPVTWAVSNEAIWAEWLVRIIQKQFNGEKVTPVILPYQFEEGKVVV
jgi:DNA-binding LacI/PurR family transcriptional regulator